MDVTDVQAGIERIKASISNDEAAHIYEDDLRQKVLESIANGTASDPREMAQLALTTTDLGFSRWCA